MRAVHTAFTIAAIWLGVVATYLAGDAWGAAASIVSAVVLIVGGIAGATVTLALREPRGELP